jgi:hypothetical protein
MDTRLPPLIWVVLAFVCLLVIIVGGLTIKLICNRAGQNQPVHCVKETILLWSITLGTEEFYDIRGAALGNTTTDDGGAYRVELLTSQGNIPLTSGYAGGFGAFSPRQDAVSQINDFVQGITDASQVTVTDPGLFNAEIVPIILILGLGHIAWANRGKLKYVLRM